MQVSTPSSKPARAGDQAVAAVLLMVAVTARQLLLIW